MNSEIITRFAPSPTGYLHIGGARTALFNWLFSKNQNGKMLLRIEDTDKTRSTKEAIDAILFGMEWLGLNWDDDVIFQSQQIDRHKEVAYKLLDSNNAYYCYCTQIELDEMRKKAASEGKSPKYNGKWRDKTPNESDKTVKPVLRIKTSETGSTLLDDLVQGQVHFKNDQLDDFVLLRSDGSPTYMLASVVDDFDMGVTDIIRGDDHLTNAARQSQIYDAMQWRKPRTSHIPLIYGIDGNKLSKRHGAMAIGDYKNMGYLPETIINYLVRLGWSHGNQEFFTVGEMIDLFKIEKVNKSPSRLDFKKLTNMNSNYIKSKDNNDILTIIKDHHQNLNIKIKDGDIYNQILTIIPSLKEKSKTINDLIELSSYLTRDDDEITVKNELLDINNQATNKHLTGIVNIIKNIKNWNIIEIENSIKSYIDDNDIKLFELAQPLRIVLTGSTVSIGIYDIITSLGKNAVINRVNKYLKN
ncbi:MAG: glutamate--tRNA ligase [Alphaproteobacteria bacterium]|jgi:glutamyl-tRNA synthetase|tara:strand:- start:12237 stop:13649 length:1413 start_codon:yes stop_codon:yes gene_type:complete